MNPVVLTPDRLVPADQTTMYFYGVTTGKSAIHRVFEAWKPLLGLEHVELRGIDVPLDSPRYVHRAVVEFIRDDVLSMGALITTHKLDVYRHASDLLRQVNDAAGRLDEVSSLVTSEGWIDGLALDTITSGLSIEALVPTLGGRHIVSMGAGGAALALVDHLVHRDADDAPASVTVTDISRDRLDSVERIAANASHSIEIRTIVMEPGSNHDALIAAAGPGAVIINATGMGKDRPGSPVSDDIVFGEGSFIWEFNYRGELNFLHQAQARAEQDKLTISDGWLYFIHGWTRVIDSVFNLGIPTSGPQFDALCEAAGAH